MFHVNRIIQYVVISGTSLAAQWLRLHTYNAGGMDLIPGQRTKWQPTPVFFPGESQGRGSLVGHHLWGHTESDTTEAT